MVTPDSTRLFSYPGLNSAGMKVTFFALVLLFAIGCGGSTPIVNQPTPQPAPNPAPVSSPVPTLFADDMINTSMIGQLWHFKDGFNNELYISVEAAPAVVNGYGGTNLIFHYLKVGCNGYWSLGACSAYLRFILHRVDQTDLDNGMHAAIGAWISTASLVEFQKGCRFCTTNPQYMTQDIGITPNGDQGYMILPASANASVQSHATSYISVTQSGTDTSVLTADALPMCFTCFTQFRTDSWAQNMALPSISYNGPMMFSHQWENCPASTLKGVGCAEELWGFIPGMGLVWIMPIQDGSNVTLDPRFTMVRQPN
jgi:hypothetical protein